MSRGRLERLLELLEKKPRDPFRRYALAMEYRKLGEIETAVAHFQKLLDDQPDYLATYFQLGTGLVELGHHEKAREVFQAGIGIAANQGDQRAVSELGAALEDLD